MGDERLETHFRLLTDGGFWDGRIFLDETVTDLNRLIVKLFGRIGPRVAWIIDWRWEDRITESDNGGVIGFIHHALYILHKLGAAIFLRKLWSWFFV